MDKIDIEKYYPSITHEQLLEAISKQLYNEYFTKPIALVRGDCIQQAEEHGFSIKDIYFVDGEPVASSLCPDDYYLVPIGKEFNVEQFAEACKEIAQVLGVDMRELVNGIVNYAIGARQMRVELESRLEELKETAERTLKNIKMMSAEVCELDYWLQTRDGWHTHHKEGKPCKAKVKPPYWHRVRSFCVCSNYH